MPPGLYQDEAYNGLDALGVLGGHFPIYFTANNGREPLFIYLVSASVAVFGRTTFAVRLPAALAGVLLLPATFALGRALFGRRLGLLAMAVAAVTFWPVALSHLGLRAGLLPVVSGLWLALAAGGLARPGAAGRRRLVAAGLLLGLCFYTYLAARFVPAALLVFLVFWYIARRHTLPTAAQTAAIAVPAVLVLIPLGLAAVRQPEILLGRAGQVSVLSPAVNGGDLWGTLFHNLLATLGMFTVRGDTIARHNLPGRPVFDAALGLFFWLGVGRAGWQATRHQATGRHRLAAALLLAWTGTLLLPTLLAEDAPHFLRAVGVLPVALLFPALGLDWLWRGFERWRGRQAPQGWQPKLPATLAVLVLATSGALTTRDYFGRYASSPDTAYLFEAAAAELARTGNAYLAEAAAGDLYLDQRLWDGFASARFLLQPDDRLHVFAPGQALLPAPGALARVVVWPYAETEARAALAGLLPGSLIAPEAGPLHRGDLEPAPYTLYAAYTAGALCPSPHCAEPPVAAFGPGGAIKLLAAAVRPAPGGTNVQLAWQAQAAPAQDWRVFVHAVAAGEIVAQADGPLGTELYPSSWWRAGERVLETRRLAWAAGAGSGVEIHIGVYDPATNARLERVDAPDDRYVLRP